MKKQQLPDINQQFSEWYHEVIMQTQLVDASPTRGCYIIRPYGYALWENIKTIVDGKIKETGTENVYFPMLIPEAFLKREAKHVEGFSPEVAVVTYAGGKQLEEFYVVRPTSETIIYDAFARWIKSWRDLPIKINQWTNVVRWEMRTRPFLRTCEFLWQEGHTAHASYEEASEMAQTMLAHYKDLAENYLAIPVITGEKPESERFAGADTTFTFEGLMPDGRALQMGTSHILAQSFPAAFNVKFQDKDGEMRSPFCTSWGVTTRLIGALVMTHGDQYGLVMPPRIAPIQAVIVPIYKTDEEKAKVFAQAEQLRKQLHASGIRVKFDNDDQKTPGAKFFEWEMKGIPVRIELGPLDLEKQQVVVVNRIESEKSLKKQFVPWNGLEGVLSNLLDTIQQKLFQRALERRNSLWYQAEKLEDFGTKLDEHNGMYQVGWCQNNACEEKIKTFKGTIRCLLKEKTHKNCFACAQPSKADIVIAKAY